MRQPTATLEELEMHITTLKAGLASHDPHKHPNEELIILREGTLETLSDGVWKRVGPGSIIFNASNSLHAVRNVGTTSAVYHVINWRSAPGDFRRQGVGHERRVPLRGSNQPSRRSGHCFPLILGGENNGDHYYRNPQKTKIRSQP